MHFVGHWLIVPVMKKFLLTMVWPAAAIAIVIAVGGCGRTHYFVENSGGGPGPIPEGQKCFSPRNLAMFAGHNGRRLSWDDVRSAMQWADVILVGEQHNDAVAHQVELALVSDAVVLAPPAGVSMEMLERNEQEIVDEYLAGGISQAEFVSRTGSANWGAKGKWNDWYQPIVDAARDAGVPLIAANSPRKYVREARIEGYGALLAHPPGERKRYFVPRRILTGTYARRFRRVMSHHAAPVSPRKPEPTTRPATRPATTRLAKSPAPTKRSVRRPKLDVNAFFRAQLVWDATMADSIARGLDGGLARVIHIVGQFHTDFDGGTVQYLLDREPDLKILTISLQNASDRELRSGDRKRADVVIYTLTEPPKDKKTDSDKSVD